jgi:putative hydrolase of the HAD superfamily
MRQHLIFDADDTLWENNIYFERVIEDFIAFLNHSTLTPDKVRMVLNEVERMMGYGTANFAHSLRETYRRLAEREVSDADLELVRNFALQVTQHPMELMEGVAETLDYLLPRHDLILLTKGDQEEQKLKIESSGLENYFQNAIIVAEKDAETYRSLVHDFDLDASKTWMIGNSPRSDINPALAAGLNAVFVPHPHTWSLEHEEISHDGTGQLLTLQTFAELRTHF